MSDFHPDLQRIARWAPRRLVGPRSSAVMRALGGLRRARAIDDVTISSPTEPTRLRIYRPAAGPIHDAGLLWIHGGGMVIGRAQDDHAMIAELVKTLRITVASVDYRLAPKHPFPAAIEDCYAGLQWLAGHAGVEPGRIAVGGASAGGGLAASLAQFAHDRGGPAIAFQLLIYPMLDDRSATRAGMDGSHHRLWDQKSNHFGWRSYLGQPPGTDAVPAEAVPARRTDFRGLPPAWIGVGSHDLFHDESVEYTEALRAAGVRCDLHIVAGAFHGFDVVAARTEVARSFRAQAAAALRDGLGLTA